MKLLAIDLGASSGRAILGDLSGDRMSLKEVHRFKNEMVEKDGHKYWDIERLRGELLTSLKNAGREAESVGIDTWGVDYAYIGKDGSVMGMPFAYRDDRTLPMVDAVHDRIGKKKLYGINGLQVMTFNTIYQMAEDVKSRPEVMAEADRMQFMPDLLGYLLTGEYTAEYSIASTSGLIDARTRKWSCELTDALGMPRRLFGEISPPGGFSAPLRKDVAKATGSHAKLTLAAGHDTASAVAATPMEGPGAMYISSGTWSLAGVELDQPVLTDLAQEYSFTNEGGVDNKIRFLKNVMGLWLIQELQRVWAKEGNKLGFGEICDEAKKAPAFASLVNPNLQRFFAPQDMRHEIEEECKRTGEPVPKGVGPLARCVFESLAMAYRLCLERIQELTGTKIGRIHIVGGGVQNKLLCQMAADACGMPVHAGPVEATAIGNLLVQAVAHGALADIGQGRRMIRSAFPLEEYRPEGQSGWHKAWERYRNLPE